MMKNRLRTMALLAMLATLAACQNRAAQLPNRANFTAAVDDYLARRGHLCIAKYDWPIRVTDGDRQSRSLDARQMPVLESFGLVQGRDVDAPHANAHGAAPVQPTREYTLTAEGSKYYLHEPVVVATATQRVTHPGDFCVAKLSLDRVFGWESPQTLAGRTVTSVLFSYQIEPAPWTRTAVARQAFPLVMRAIDNAHSLQLRLGVHLTSRGWVADELSE